MKVLRPFEVLKKADICFC